MKNLRKTKGKISIEEIEGRAARGEDVSQYFDYKNAKMHPGYGKMERIRYGKEVQRVNVDLSQEMLSELDAISKGDNVPRQSVIKNMLRAGIDRYFSNKKLRKV